MWAFIIPAIQYALNHATVIGNIEQIGADLAALFKAGRATEADVVAVLTETATYERPLEK